MTDRQWRMILYAAAGFLIGSGIGAFLGAIFFL